MSGTGESAPGSSAILTVPNVLSFIRIALIPVFCWLIVDEDTTMAGILLPSSILTYSATKWAHKNRELRAVRAFKTGMAPIVIALMMATGWLLIAAKNVPARDWPMWLLAAAATLLVWRTKVHLLWMIGAGALLGGLGWV